MRLKLARSIPAILVLALAANFIYAFEQDDRVLFAGAALGIAAAAFILSEWIRLAHARRVENIARAERDLLDALDIDYERPNGGA